MAGTTQSVKRQWGISSTLNAIKAFYEEINNIITDLETLRSPLAESNTLIEELHDDSGTTATWDIEVDGDLDTINDYLHYLNKRDGVIGGDFTFAAGAAVTITGSGDIHYRIAGVEYYAVLDTTIVLEDSGDIIQDDFGAWAILIDSHGVVTTQDTGVAAPMAHGTAIDALLSLSSRVNTAGTIPIGYLVVTDSNSVFSPNADQLTATGVTATLYAAKGPREMCGINEDDATLAITAPDAAKTWNSGAVIDVRTAGGPVAGPILAGNQTQLAAITTQVMDDADTVDINDFGGWLLVWEPAGSVYALAANGIAGAVTAMTFTTAALRDTDLDLVEARLPLNCAPIGRILLNNVGGGNAWAAITDDWNHDTAVTTVENYTNKALDRTSLVNNVGLEAPAVPGTISAPLTPGVGSSKPTSSGVNAAGDLVAASIATIESGD